MSGDTYANFRKNAEYRKAIKDIAAEYGLDEGELAIVSNYAHDITN